MLFLLFGGGTRCKEIGTGAQRTCPRCGNTTTWHRLQRFHELTFFLIPVARWSRRELEACPICDEEHALSEPAPRRPITHRYAAPDRRNIA